MCDISCIRVRTPRTRYRKYHWKFSLRPFFSNYHFTEPHPLNKTLSLVPVTVGYENSRLVTIPDSTLVADLHFDRSWSVRLPDKAFKIGYDRPARGFVFTNEYQCVARRVRRWSRVLLLEWGIQRLMIIPVHPWKKDFVVCVVEQEGRRVDNMKVVEIVRTSLEERYEIRFVEFATLELVACVAWLTIIVNR